MKPAWLLPAALLGLLHGGPCLAASVAAETLLNPDFETGRVGEMPAAWSDLLASVYGASVSLSNDRPHRGHACVEIRHDPNSRTGSAGQVYLRQTIAATPFRGHRVELSGWLRCEPAGSVSWPVSAHLWMYAGGTPDFSVDLGNHPVRSVEWAFAHIVCEVSLNADSLSIGGYLDSAGRAWFDDLRLVDCGPIGAGDEAARPLSARGAANLVAFARLLGYVRHFHPSDEAAGTDWDQFTIAGVDAVEGATTDKDFAKRLARLFHPVAPTLRVSTQRLPPLDRADLPGSAGAATGITGWQHRGWPWPTAGPFYTERRVVAAADAPGDSLLPLGSEANVDLGGGAWASIPLTLCRDSRGTLPHTAYDGEARRPSRPRGWTPTARDRATRLAGVMLFWNVAQHFYPNFDLSGSDWPAALAPALVAAAADTDEASFIVTLRKLSAHLADGHVAVNGRHWVAPVVWPLNWEFVEGRLVVTQVDSTRARGARLGDEILALQGRPTTDWVRLLGEQWHAASEGRTRLLIARALQSSCSAESLALDLRSPSGVTRRVRLASGGRVLLAPTRPDTLAQLGPGILYLDMTRVTTPALDAALARLSTSPGLVLDFRGYPRNTRSYVAEHLIDSTTVCGLFWTPIILRPDHADSGYARNVGSIEPASPRFRGKVAILIDAAAQSMAEDMVAALEVGSQAILVGEPTSGTSGTVTSVALPGGFNVAFTGERALKPDGSRLVGVGILPAVLVPRTIAGVAAGRDEQLDRAVELVRDKRSSTRTTNRP